MDRTERKLILNFLDEYEKLKHLAKKEKLTDYEWEELSSSFATVIETLEQLYTFDELKNFAERGIGVEKKLVYSLFEKLNNAEIIDLSLLANLSLFMDLKEDIKDLYFQLLEEDRENAINLLNELNIAGNTSLSGELFINTPDSDFKLNLNFSFYLTLWFQKCYSFRYPAYTWEVKLLEKALRNVLLAQQGPQTQKEVIQLEHLIIELPITLKPSKETHVIGKLLKELLLKYLDLLILRFEEYIDKELPENARPQLLYVTRALIRFLENCGEKFEKLFEELRQVPERYGVSKKEFKEILTLTTLREKKIAL